VVPGACRTGRPKAYQEEAMSVLHRGVPPTRRQVLTAAGGGAAALALPGRPGAKMPLGLPQVPYFYRFKLGSAECTVVSDGILPLGNPSDSFVNISKEEIARELRDNFLPTNDAVLEQNVLVVNFGDRSSCSTPGWGATSCTARRRASCPPPCARPASTPPTSTRW
jgi:hypothetical protein